VSACARVWDWRIKDGGGVKCGRKDTYPSADRPVVVHDDIGPAILASIPFHLAIIKTCKSKSYTRFVSKKKSVKEGNGFALVCMPGRITSLFAPRPILAIGFVVTKSMRSSTELQGRRQPKNGGSRNGPSRQSFIAAS